MDLGGTRSHPPFGASPSSTFPADALRDTLSDLVRRYRVPGAQLAIHRDGETVSVEVGELEHGTGRAVTRDSAFAIGSITTSFTATLAMVLAADGAWTSTRRWPTSCRSSPAAPTTSGRSSPSATC